MGLAARIEILFFCERHIAFIPFDKTKSWAARIEITFFCERHVALIPLDKTKLCERGEPLTLESRSFPSDTPSVCQLIKRKSMRWWAVEVGI